MLPIRILLADDHPTFLDIARRYLQKQDGVIVIGTAAGGHEALSLAQSLRPQVVLIDLAMPDLPGLHAIPRLREAQPGLGIIALTLHDSDAYRQASLEAGADDFVAKARLTDDLLPAIRRVVLAGDRRRGSAWDDGRPEPEREARRATASADA